MNMLNLAQPVYRIAIIGGGPKGTYGFERLAAQLKAYPVDSPVEIHVFNRTPYFGAGDVYRPDQPDFLLINFCIGNINMWLDKKYTDTNNVEPPAVVENPRSLTAWLCEKHQPPLPVCDLDYASRAQVGRYLQAGFDEIAEHLPPNVRGKYVVGEVVDLRPDDDSYHITICNQDGDEFELPQPYHKVLLATGHPRPTQNMERARYHQFCQQHLACDYVPFIYPVRQKLSAILPKSTVAIKGLGLTFVDAALSLTEGRGGHFVRDKGSKKLVYHPSGNEPAAIYPFSRSGLPMLARGAHYGASQTPLCVFTQERIGKIRNHSTTGKVDFEKELWPLLRLEMLIAYYHVLFSQRGRALMPGAAENQLSNVLIQIERFHQQHPELERFTPEEFLDPLHRRTRSSDVEHHDFVVDYLRKTIAEAKKGEAQSPWMAAVAVWREATPIFGSVYRFGGLTPESQRLFEQRYGSALNRTTFGPPIESMEKILALAEVGTIDFGLSRSANVAEVEESGTFCLQSDYVDANQDVHCLIDARIPKVSLLNESARLYQNLARRGLVAPFENQSASSDKSYQPGCIALSPSGYIIDALGNENRTLAATGTPTEGITFDNDSLSRTRNNFVSQWAANTRQEIEEFHAQTECCYA